jgi:hypothetical protein
MTRRRLLIVVGLLVCTIPLGAQGKSAAADPVSGNWTGDGNRGASFDLKYDGKRAVTGTIGTPQGPADIKVGTFDRKTRMLKLEGEAKDREGKTVQYLIEGKIEGEAATGTWQFGDAKGTFNLKRKAKPE